MHHHTITRTIGLTGLMLSSLLIPGPATASQGGFNRVPNIIHGPVNRTVYDGAGDDLLTAGLGRTGLAGTPPAVASPPTAAELRRLAIYNNYRALVDMTAGGGYGMLYGPNVTIDGAVTGNEGLIPGVEYLAYGSRGNGRENVTLMVQIPNHFDPAQPCIVTGPSSGSRGIYGAIATAGEWGLKRGCAVAYTDKGTGNGAHDLQNNRVDLIDGVPADAGAAGKASQFTARLSDAKRAAYNTATPNRFAFKHAHSQRNPEQDWGQFVLWSVRFAFYAINQEYGEPFGPNGKIRPRFTPDNTLVIASSVSNGGGASVRAAEQDRQGLIDAVVVSEPNVNPVFDPDFVIRQGSGAPLAAHSRSLFDYTTLLNLYQGCANGGQLQAPFNLTLALFPGLSENRCQSLHEKGLLPGATLAAQQVQAQARINAYGILPEQNLVQPSHWWASVPQAIAVTYANAYARTGVEQRLCGYSFGATSGNSLGTVPGTGEPVPLAASATATLFSTGNGIPPTGGVEVINDASLGGPLLDRRSVSPSNGHLDENLDGALCLRALATGVDPVTGVPLSGQAKMWHRKILRSIARLRASGDLHGRPALIVTGRSDAILPPDHASRAYFGLNQRVEGDASRLHYIEVTNAQHLDAFNAFAGFDTRYLPLHHYYIQALNLMWAHLTAGAALPPSQVVHTTPRGGTPGAAPTIDPAVNLPPIAASPPSEDRVRFNNGELFIPE